MPKSHEPASAGTVLVKREGSQFGDYHLLEEIGRGGMGAVFKARQLPLNRIVAVKILLAGPLASGPLVDRFRTEAEAVAQLQHPHIVAIYEAGQHEGVSFFSMEYVPGRTLADLVAQRPLPPETAAQYLRTIAEAIHFAHEHGVLHRDLKPSNVLIDASGRPRVTDFGLAKRLSSTSDLELPASHLTITGQVLGSPSYVAPEQAGARRRTVGPASDIYALGAILFHLLTGRPPFLSESLEGTLLQVLTTEPIGVRRLNPDVPRDLETICSKCLQKEPARRYATAAALAEDLQRFLNREPILARPVNSLEKLWRWCRRSPALSATVLMLHLVLGAGAIGILLEWRQAEEGRQAAREHLYAADMLLAQQAIETDRTGRAVELLEKHNPRTTKAANGSRLFSMAHPALSADLRGWEWFYFRSQCASDELATLGAHSNAVSVMAFAPSGDLLATGDLAGGLKVWSVRERGLLAARWDDHQDLLALAFSPDGRLLAAGGADECVRVYEAARLRPLSPPLTHSNLVVALDFSADGQRLRVCSRDELVWWDIAEARRTKQQKFDAHYRTVLAPGSELVAVPESGGAIHLYDTASGAVTVRDTAAQTVSALAFSPDGQRLYAGCDGYARGWDLAGGRQISLFPSHSLQIHSLTVSPDGKLLAAGTSDETIRLWDALNGPAWGVLRGQNSPVRALAFAPDGQILASGGKDGLIKLWPTHPSPPRTQAVPFSPPTRHWCLAPDASALEWRQSDGKLYVFDFQTLQALQPRPFRAKLDGCVAIAPEGLVRAVDEGHGAVSLWNRATDDCFGVLDGAPDPVRSMTFSADGKTLAIAGLRGEVQLWNIPSRRLLRKLRGYSEVLTGRFCFSADGRQLAAGYLDGRSALWRLDHEPEPAIWQAHEMQLYAEVFSPNGSWLCTVAADGLARIWETSTRRQIAQLSVSAVDALSADFSPDGKRLAVGARDGAVTLYDLATFQPIAHFHEHADPSVYAVAFTADGSALVSVSLVDVVVRRAPLIGLKR
jgi:WD40 repeat protein/serine/threonine protein kinase